MQKRIDTESLSRLINRQSNQDVKLSQMMSGQIQIPSELLGSQKTERRLQVENVMKGNRVIENQVKSMTR